MPSPLLFYKVSSDQSRLEVSGVVVTVDGTQCAPDTKRTGSEPCEVRTDSRTTSCRCRSRTLGVTGVDAVVHETDGAITEQNMNTTGVPAGRLENAVSPVPAIVDKTANIRAERRRHTRECRCSIRPATT